MKELFPEYFDYSPEEYRELWQNCIFSLDANVLLNFYRYSNKTREQFFHTLESIKDRLWISHFAAYEFFETRFDVIGQQEKFYQRMIGEITAMKNDLYHRRKHPFVNDKLLLDLDRIVEPVLESFLMKQQEFAGRIFQDSIKTRISNLFEYKVGREYSREEYLSLARIGTERYEAKIPPGYMEDKKGNSENHHSYSKYGAFMVWTQLLEKSKKAGKNIIFLTDTSSTDWWRKHKSKIVGPRPELIKEFSRDTGHKFYMYQPDKFLEHSEEYLKQKIQKETLIELRELRELSERHQKREENIISQLSYRRLLMKNDLERTKPKKNKKEKFLTNVYGVQEVLSPGNRLK